MNRPRCFLVVLPLIAELCSNAALCIVMNIAELHTGTVSGFVTLFSVLYQHLLKTIFINFLNLLDMQFRYTTIWILGTVQ